MKYTLTDRQQEILEFIRTWSAEKQMAPTLNQMAEHFGVKCSTIAYHVEALRKKGRLDRTSESRSIVLKDQSSACLRRNCLRKIDIRQQGDSRPDGQNGSVFVPDEIIALCNLEQVIAFRMPDDSMFELGMHCGDTLLAVPVEFRPPAPGDIVLAVTPDGRTLIRSYYPFSARKFELIPANSDFPTETYPASGSVIRGVVMSLFRNY